MEHKEIDVIYQRALVIEFKDKNIHYSREQTMPVLYKQHQIGTRRVYFLIDDKIMLEIKALIELEGVHLAPSDQLPGSV